jgi:hypothetical protein
MLNFFINEYLMKIFFENLIFINLSCKLLFEKYL